MKTAQRVQQLAESATLAVSAKAAKLKADGVDVVSLAAGEPDFDTPQNVKAAGIAAINAGKTKYSKPSSGLPEAKKAVCEKLKRENGLSYEPSQIILTSGAKDAILLLFMTVIDPGDEVIVPVPYWVSYPEQIKLAGGKPVFVPGDEARNFEFSLEDLEAAFTDKTRMLVLNSPNNPGGFTYSPTKIRQIASLLAGRDILVLSDEIYDRLLYGDARHMSFATASEQAYAQTITVNGGSKTYAMTGWRAGYAAGDATIIKGMSKLQSQGTSGQATFTQLAQAAALTEPQDTVVQMREQFEKRAFHMHKRLTEMDGVSCVPATGAFYCFPNVSRTYDKLGVSGSVDFATKLLQEAHVAVVPGIAFGCDDNVRVSFATSMEQIDKGLDRIVACLNRA